MNIKLWILTISAFFSLIALVGCSADASANILNGANSSYINEDMLDVEE